MKLKDPTTGETCVVQCPYAIISSNANGFYTFNDIQIFLTKLPINFTNIKTTITYPISQLINAVSNLNVVALLWAYVGVVRSSVQQCPSCKQLEKWDPNTLSYKHTCYDDKECSTSIFDTSPILKEVHTKQAEFVKFSIYFLTNNETIDNAIEYSGISKNIGNKFVKIIIEICSWAELKWGITIRETGLQDATFYKRSTKSKNKPVKTNHCEMRIMAQHKKHKSCSD